MVKINLPVKPMSINHAWRGGQRFRTREYKQLERDVLLLTKGVPKESLSGELSVRYVFHIKNYGLTDVANLEKCITDILVKGQIIKDDRYIKDMYVRKERSKDEHIEVWIEPYTKSSP